jgi:SAM-dependent methyltransferase
MEVKHKNWFERWFDSPYYHILYKDRDDEEAEFFLNNLFQHLHTPKDAKILDLACGRGRHSIYLNKLGFDVTGLDLSPQNIEYAHRYGNDKLKFFVHDMRKVFKVNEFDVVLNLFTSFGYFGNPEEDEKVVQSVYNMLKPDGVFVLDYLNVNKLDFADLTYDKEVDGVHFNIRKYIVNEKIVKEIHIKDADREYQFSEYVSAITPERFYTMFKNTGFKYIHVFGSYELDEYTVESCPRFIIIGRK